VLAAQIVEEPTGATHPVDGARRQGDGPSIDGDVPDVVDREIVAGQKEWAEHGERVYSHCSRSDISAIHVCLRRRGTALLGTVLDPCPGWGVPRESDEEHVALDRNQPAVGDRPHGRCPGTS
jgi:hypothetical protein